MAKSKKEKSKSGKCHCPDKKVHVDHPQIKRKPSMGNKYN